MIVVAIIAFLATIAIPRYTHYFSRARHAEVALNLASLHTALETHYAIHQKYTTILSGKGGVGWQPQGYRGGGKQENFHYTYGFNFPGAQEGVHYFTGKFGTPAQALGSTSAGKDQFVVKAAATIKAESSPDVWSIDQSRKLVHEHDGT